MKAVFYHDVSVAESVRSEAQKVNNIFHELETAVLDISPELGSHTLSVASSMRQIYDNSLRYCGSCNAKTFMICLIVRLSSIFLLSSVAHGTK